ncbi:hypothetical protein HGRIS_003992 [Hohenbuehelia grisea]|uniref:Uncharacterized protein n=1 Tax=Hohenbuehelia grisea TaxID=104357 RepID=A0ABR3JIV7_9AGAR
MPNLISAVGWVAQGVATRNPAKYVLDEAELQRVSTLARIELEDARVELERAHKAASAMRDQGEDMDDADADADNAQDDDGDDAWVDDDQDAMDVDPKPVVNGTKKDSNDLAEYNLDSYDDDADPTAGSGLFSNIKGLTYYRNNEEDPYITLKEDPEDDERGELEVLPTDNLLVAAKTEDDIPQLDIYLYDPSQDNLYVHHDIMLPSFPLCLEWLDFAPPAFTSSSSDTPAARPPGNFIAVGTLEPEIEIWSLDVIDPMYPDAILGRADEDTPEAHVPVATGKKKKKKKPKKVASALRHTDAVLGLSWNRTHRNLLASASADHTVKLWDLSRAGSSGGEHGGAVSAIRSFDVHTDKVQAVQWNAQEPTVLLTGSYDRTVRTFDSRAPDAGVGALLGADVEALRWDPWEPHGFYVSLENGLILNFDARTLPTNPLAGAAGQSARFTLSAHDGAASALDVSPHLRGCIVTGGTDKIVKVWNVSEAGDAASDGKRSVSLVTSRDLGVGKVFSASFSPDDPLVIAAAGSKAALQLWDVAAVSGARKAFSSKLHEAGWRRAAGRWKKADDGTAAAGGGDDDEEESGSKRNGGVIGLVDDAEESEGDEE